MEQSGQQPQTLCIKHLAKNYSKRWVVKDVSFTMQSGQIVGLLGPNGAGKTTSFYMVVGLVRMDKGEIHLDDLDLSDLAMHERARKGIGYLPQEASIFRKLTIAENIMAILETRKELNKAQREQRLKELLDDFKISHIKDSLGMSVSGGERRRAEIARALAANPKFMLLDEPFAGVDPISVGDIKEIIQNLKNRGIGVLITDHNVQETLAITDKTYLMFEGGILKAGKPEEIFIEREKSGVAHRADHAVIALRPLCIVGFENPGDCLMPVPDEVSGQQIAAADREAIAAISRPVKMKVLVGLSCTMCPEVAVATQRIAAENPKVETAVYDVNRFPALKDAYDVMSVPCLVINDGGDERVAFGKKGLTEILSLIGV